MATRQVQLRAPGPRARARQAPWNPTASRDEARSYLQDRMALFSKLLFWIFLILVVFVLTLYRVYPETRPAHPEVVHDFAVASLIALVIVWYSALHRNDCSIETLYRIDILYALVVGTALGLSAYFTSDRVANSYSAFIWHTFMVFVRVIVVPSSARRTAWVTSLSFLPIVAASTGIAVKFPERIGLPALAAFLGALLFSVVAVVLATTGSKVIYGLRRQVREAVQLGQYILEEKIGEGGMGAVYKAHHAMLRRPTAIKLLPLDKYAADSATRFEREVQATSQLTHPNTIAVFDYGRSPNGLFYYAMEYVDGIDLERLVSRFGRQPAGRVIRILEQVCGALDEAHSVGLIHRDVKPANILLCQRGRKPDAVKVVDFGLVAQVASPGPDRSQVVQGTPAYLSPEAVTSPGSIGPRSDLYSLGAVAYFLLTGERVFDSDSPVQLCVMHASKEPVPPSRRADVPIPDDLEALVMRCLAKDPAERPASAEALARELASLSESGDWSEADAAAWWLEFDENRGASSPEAPPPSIVTVTADVRDRVDLLDGAVELAQDLETGQATK